MYKKKHERNETLSLEALLKQLNNTTLQHYRE